MGQIKQCVSYGSILDLLLFLCYVSDLPKGTISKATHILFADDTVILITSPNTTMLQNYINIVFKEIQYLFSINSMFWSNGPS
jgi:hypothetical protein